MNIKHQLQNNGQVIRVFRPQRTEYDFHRHCLKQYVFICFSNVINYTKQQ